MQIKGDWDNSGPELNIEFSRVSKDGRLTLVIDLNNGVEVKTYFAQSKRSDLGDAVASIFHPAASAATGRRPGRT